MDIPLLELNLCKVHNQLQTLVGNEYSNLSLDHYQHNLFQLFHHTEQSIRALATGQRREDADLLADTLSFISLSIQFLEDSTLNQIPFETLFCLEKALKDWVEGEYTFVTSLNKEEYYFDPSLSLEDSLFELIERHFAIHFTNRLIQISVPRHEVNDYFFNVVLYHELGHFIDLKHSISESFIYQEYPNLTIEESIKKSNHYREYFADLFAAQYVDRNVCRSLSYEVPLDSSSDTHPSTTERLQVVDDFLNGRSNPIIDDFQQVLKKILGKQFEIRFEMPNQEDFYAYVPPIITSDRQLHGLFVAGWDTWFNHRERFQESDHFKIYLYLNNLIEKSISNYMITQSWKTHQYVSE